MASALAVRQRLELGSIFFEQEIQEFNFLGIDPLLVDLYGVAFVSVHLHPATSELVNVLRESSRDVVDIFGKTSALVPMLYCSEVIGTLKPEEQILITERYGLYYRHNRSWEGTFKVLSLTKKEGWEMKKRSFIALRHPCRSKYLQPLYTLITQSSTRKGVYGRKC